jgi:hypothetical protein
MDKVDAVCERLLWQAMMNRSSPHSSLGTNTRSSNDRLINIDDIGEFLFSLHDVELLVS